MATISQARAETLMACRTHNGKRYLVKEMFEGLDQKGKVEAVLWMHWPRSMKTQTILRICNIPNRACAAIHRLWKEGRLAQDKSTASRVTGGSNQVTKRKATTTSVIDTMTNERAEWKEVYLKEYLKVTGYTVDQIEIVECSKFDPVLSVMTIKWYARKKLLGQ
jgi:hypothetical protein